MGAGSDAARTPLHRARLDAGWAREKLAWEVGASQASMLRWELSGKQPQRQEHVDRLARVLDRPADELFPGRDNGVSVPTGGRSVDSGSVDARSPLHRARLNAGWTREKLARKVGASQASMLRWELFGKQPRRQEHVPYELFGAWSAPVFTVLTVIGFLGLAHFFDPAAAHLQPAQLAEFYAVRDLQVEIGMSIFCVATAFLTVFCVQLSISLWRIERASPLMVATQALGGFGVVMLIFISCCLWIGAAYRADVANPDVTVALNDAAWFGFLVGWVMLSLQMLATAAITLHDRRDEPLVPRWVSIASVIGGVLLVTANGCAVTKTGPFAWDGALGYYLPMAIWGVWLDLHAYYVRKEIRRRNAAPAAAPAATQKPVGALT